MTPKLSTEPITTTKTPTLSNVIPGNAQHIGARLVQQDAFCFSDISDEAFCNQYGALAVLADGMGGLSGGKEASQLAIRSFLNDYLHTTTIYSIPEKLSSAAKVANDAVVNFAKEHGLEGGVGTTLIATVILKNQLYWLSVGDSRIYHVSANHLIQLTTDHIYAKELDEQVERGEITREEAEQDPQRESLASFLGLETLDEIDISPDPILLQKGDTIILCSDGLYGSVTADEMLETCRNLPTQEAAEKLIEFVLCKQKVNQDNVTVALLTFESTFESEE